MLAFFSTLPSTFLLKSELQMADPCTDLLLLQRYYNFKLLFHMKTLKGPGWHHHHPPKMLTDEAGKTHISICLKTKKFQDFCLVLSTFQMLSSVVDFRDALLFFWIGNQASFLLECTNNSWNICQGHFNCPVTQGFSLLLPTPPVLVVLSAFCSLGRSYGFWLFLTKES